MKLRTGDTVIITAGKDKGKTGTIMRLLSSVNRVVVSGINMRTKHVKKTYQQAGQILRYEASLHASNVMVLDPKTKKGTRIGYKTNEKGKKVRIAKKSGEEIVRVKAKKESKKATDAAVTEEDKKTTKAKKTVKEAETTEAQSGEKKLPAGDATKAQPFWKKMKFGSAAIDAAEVDEGSRMTQDHTIPEEQIHIRKGGRGT